MRSSITNYRMHQRKPTDSTSNHVIEVDYFYLQDHSTEVLHYDQYMYQRDH